MLMLSCVEVAKLDPSAVSGGSEYSLIAGSPCPVEYQPVHLIVQELEEICIKDTNVEVDGYGQHTEVQGGIAAHKPLH